MSFGTQAISSRATHSANSLAARREIMPNGRIQLTLCQNSNWGAVMLDIPVRSQEAQVSDFVVCGWYTPDYRNYWERLRANLENINSRHDFIEVLKPDQGWEANTMRKAEQALVAMDRHPDTTIIFIDVDCVVLGTLDDLSELARIPGDVGLFLHTKWKQHGSPWIGIRSGTLVIKPTAAARQFIECWRSASAAAPRYCTDQDSIRYALGCVPNLSVTLLDIRYCAVPGDRHPSPVIFHYGGHKPNKARKYMKIIGRAAWATRRLFMTTDRSEHRP